MPADFAIGPPRKRKKPDRVSQAVKAVRAASSGPRTDAQTSGRNYGVRKADKFKQTRPYRQAVEAAVRSQPAAVRAQRVNQVAGRVKAGKYTGHTPIEDLVVARRSDRLAKAYAGPKGQERQRKMALQRQYTHQGPAQRAVATDYKERGVVEQALFAALPGFIRDTPVVGSAFKGVAEATYHDPVGVPTKTAKGAVDIAAATPAAVAQLVTGIGVPFATGHPGTAGKNALGVLKQAAADYSRRYGPLATGGERGYDQFVQRIRDEGFAPEFVDFAGVAAGGGAVAGRALGAAARAGKLSSRLERIATEPRPDLRISAGVSRPQELSPNLFKAAAAKRLDQARVSRNAKQTVRAVARDERAPIQPDAGQVRPLSRTLEKRAQRKEVSKDQSRAFINTRRELKQELSKGAQHDLVRLSPVEQDAVFHTVQGALPIHGSGADIRRAAQRRLKQIYGEREGRVIERAFARSGVDADQAHTARMLVRRARERGAGDATPEGLVADLKRAKAPAQLIRAVEAAAPELREALKDSRVLRKRGEIDTLKRITENADELAGSQKLKEFQASHLERSKRLEGVDPALEDVSALARRYGPQGEVLGLPNPRLQGTVRRAVKVAKAKVTQAERRVARADTTIRRAERHERRQLGRVDVHSAQADAKTLRADPKYRKAAQELGAAQREFRDAKKAFGNAHRNPDLYTKAERVAIEQRTAKAARDLAEKRERFGAAKRSVNARAAKAVTEAAANRPSPAADVRVNKVPADAPRFLPVEKTGGTPDIPADQASWYHGTPRDFGGNPTAKGQWSDLGVYLTSDPHYAGGYAELGGAPGKVLEVRVQPRNVLEMRAGRADPKELASVVDAILERNAAARKAAGRPGPSKAINVTSLEGWQRSLRGGEPITPEEMGNLLNTLQDLSSDIGRLEGKKGTGNRHQVLADTLRGLGYDAIRKVDQRSDALVVLDEKILRRTPSRRQAQSGKAPKANPLVRLGRAPTRPLDSLERKRSTLQEAELEKKAAEADLKAARDGVREAQTPGSTTVKVDEKLTGKARDDARNKHLADAEAKVLRDWVDEVRKRAAAEGLPEPAYIRHQPDSRVRLGLRSLGGISQATALVHRSELELFQQGRATAHPAVILEGLGANIKRKHQWRAVGDVFDKHTLPWARNMTGKQIVDEINTRGLNLNDFHLVDTKKYRVVRDAIDPDGDAVGEDPLLREALRESIVPLGDKSPKGGGKTYGQLKKEDKTGTEEWLNTKGFALVDRGIGDELLGGASAPSTVGRVFGKVQGIQSAAILGLNPSWLLMQVAANTLATAFGTKGALGDLVKGTKLYGALSQNERDMLDTFSGIGVLEAHTGQHIGSVIDSQAVASARQMATTRVGVALRHVSPTKLMFLADDAQNRAFRRGVLTNRLKREAFQRIRKESGRMAEAMARVEQLLKLGPTDSVFKQVQKVLENPKDVERLAESVNNVLGDFTRYTVKERRGLKNYVMFYGFLRYALKTAFYTMPVRHPIMSAIALKLGQLHVDEVKELLGGDAAPWAYSRIFFKGKGGQLSSIDLGRINPVTSPLTELVSEGPKASLGLVSPMVQAGMDQAFGGVGFEGGRGFKVGGSAAENRNPDLEARARIVVGQVSSATFPVRLGKLLTQGGGRQGDDSLLFSPRPIKYKTAEAIARNQQRIARSSDKRDILLQQIFPLFVPKPDYSKDAQGVNAPSAPPDLSGLSNWERQQIREAAKQAQQGPQLSNWEREQIRQALSGG